MSAVAAHARVGIGTVSRVVNDSPNVSPDTRQRVEAAMAAVGYTPRRRRHGAIPGRASFIGVIATFFEEPSVYCRLKGLIAALRPHGYQCVVYSAIAPSQISEYVAEVITHPLDGLVVVTSTLSADDSQLLLRAPFPTILVDANATGFPSIGVDDRLGGEIATRHLIDLGHRRVGFIGQPDVNPFGSLACHRREQGYRTALRKAGIKFERDFLRHGDHLKTAARQMALDLLSQPNRVTAIVASSDVQALGVIEAATSIGLSVPEDLSVVGYDDLDIAEQANLTTIRQPLEASGERAASLLIQAISYPQPVGGVEVLPIELIVRGSTKPLARGSKKGSGK